MLIRLVHRFAGAVLSWPVLLARSSVPENAEEHRTCRVHLLGVIRYPTSARPRSRPGTSLPVPSGPGTGSVV